MVKHPKLLGKAMFYSLLTCIVLAAAIVGGVTVVSYLGPASILLLIPVFLTAVIYSELVYKER